MLAIVDCKNKVSRQQCGILILLNQNKYEMCLICHIYDVTIIFKGGATEQHGYPFRKSFPTLLIQAHVHIILQVPPFDTYDSIVEIQLNSSYYQIRLHCTVQLTFRQLLFFSLMFQ